jgi:hypothetical protein
MRRFSLRNYFDRHPAVPLSLACLTMIYAVARSVQAVMRARGTVHASWAPAVAMGLASWLMLVGVTVGSFWAYRRRIQSAWLRRIQSAWLWGLFFGLCGVFLAGMMYTGPAVVPKVGPPETVTTGFQLAAIAFMIPLYGGIAALMVLGYLQLARNRKNLPGHKNRPAGKAAVLGTRRGDVLTALIGLSKDGWSVTWIRVGNTPRPLTAPTLTAAAEQATAAAARRWQNQQPGAAAELTLTIYPTRSKHGPTLEITGVPGAYTATSPESGAAVHGATLEDLLAAAPSAIDPAVSGFTLRWTRPVTALPLATPPLEHPPASAT